MGVMAAEPSGPKTTTYRRPSVSIGQGLDGADYSYLTKKTAESTGFFITFNVPFKRTDIFAELLSDNGQLGADGPESGVTYTILKPGREAGKPVRDRRTCTALGTPPALTRPSVCLAGLERLRARGHLHFAGVGPNND